MNKQDVENAEIRLNRIQTEIKNPIANWGVGYTAQVMVEYANEFAKRSPWVKFNFADYKTFPDYDQKIIFKLIGGEPRMGILLRKDPWGRMDMFCDGAFHKAETIIEWMYVPD